jgi:RNA-directed DNA polymerase
MRRLNNLYEQVISPDNLRLAEEKARKGKKKQYGVMLFDKRKEESLELLHEMLCTKTYRTSPYTVFKVYEPKERIVYRLPYFPDRITHHAIMNILEPVFVSVFTADTYSCIKGKGIHAASYNLRKALKDEPGTQYCLKLDIKKFYPSIDHSILKELLRRKIKDKDLLWLLDEIIDSAEGVPIGNYLSQYFANFYLAYFDHWIKEVKRIKYYFRYADDIVILSDNKKDLHRILYEIKAYLQSELKLEVKRNYQVFPVKKRGIDFVGYPTFHDHVRLRKSIKKNFCRAVYRKKKRPSIEAYKGWAKHCNSKNLLKKLLNEKL